MSEFPLPNNSSDLSGEVALVTGTTSGLGRRFAKVLASAGAKVVLTGRRTERLDQLATEIRADGGECVPLRLDMSDMDSIREVAQQAEDALGTVTILVNNAAHPAIGWPHKMNQKQIDVGFDTNLRGPFVLSGEVGRRLIAAKRPGRIVNISSTTGLYYAGEAAALYSITKAGLIRMSQVLAVDWSRYRINVNCIVPGAFQSEMMDGMIERGGDFTDTLPRKRLGDPAQLDSTLLYLCAPASEAVTGAVITVDDGQWLR